MSSRGGIRSVNRGIGGLGIELRKTKTGMPALLPVREGETNTDTKLVRSAIPRSRRPHARRETCMFENRETSPNGNLFGGLLPRGAVRPEKA